VRILVTGAAGYIGSWLAPELRNAGHVLLERDLATGHDIAAPGRFAANLDDTRPDVVVHLAAKIGRVWGEIDRSDTIAANVGLAATVATECGRRGIRLVFTSTSEVYGPATREGPRRVDEQPNPLNLYGLTKQWGEQVCALYAPQGLTVLRLNMPYGPGPARLGEVGYNALHTFLYQAHRGRPIDVHKGTRRCFTWVGDTVRAIRMLIEQTTGGVFNVCRNDDHRDMAEVARLACQLAGETTVREVDPPDQVTLVKSLDNTALLDLGWRPTVALEDGAARTHEWVVEQCR
jgi:nucleoside-diphosphate-sugar epimerase